VHHAYAYSTSQEGWQCGGFTNRQTDKVTVTRDKFRPGLNSKEGCLYGGLTNQTKIQGLFTSPFSPSAFSLVMPLHPHLWGRFSYTYLHPPFYLLPPLPGSKVFSICLSSLTIPFVVLSQFRHPVSNVHCGKKLPHHMYYSFSQKNCNCTFWFSLS